MSLLANVLGFSAFGFATRCFQLGLQKRFMFAGMSHRFLPFLLSLLSHRLVGGSADIQLLFGSSPNTCSNSSRFRSGRMGCLRVGTATVSVLSMFLVQTMGGRRRGAGARPRSARRRSVRRGRRKGRQAARGRRRTTGIHTTNIRPSPPTRLDSRLLSFISHPTPKTNTNPFSPQETTH